MFARARTHGGYALPLTAAVFPCVAGKKRRARMAAEQHNRIATRVIDEPVSVANAWTTGLVFPEKAILPGGHSAY